MRAMKAAVFLAFAAFAQPDPLMLQQPQQPMTGCYEISATGTQSPDPLLQRMLRYAEVAVKHRIEGLASYYSTFFDGRRTANGETYRNAKYSAEHLTLPLGTWIEVKSRATG